MSSNPNPTGLDLSLIGCSDVAAVLDLDQRNSPVSLIARLVHGIDPPNTGLSWAGDVGRFDEEPIARMLLSELDRVGDDVEKPVSRIRPPGRPWQRYSIDFVTGLQYDTDGSAPVWRSYPGQDQDLIEAKLREWSSFSSQGWGSVNGTDGVPSSIMLQVQAQLEAVSYDRDFWRGSDIPDLGHAYVACRVGAFDFHWYRIERNVELGEVISSKCEEFWARYVVGDEAPPLDGSDSTRRYLAAVHDKPTKDWSEATADDLALMQAYQEAKAAAEAAAKEKKRIENLIIDRIANSYGLDFGQQLGRIAYRPERGRTSNAKVIEELAAMFQIPSTTIDDLKEQHRGAGSRKFDARLK